MQSKTRAKTKRRMAPAAALLVGLSAALVSVCGQAAVVRPTIFSDLNSPPESVQVGPQQPQQQQQQQQSQAAPPQQVATQHAHLADGPASQPAKITPVKSRFCSSAASGARTDQPLGLQSLAVDDLALSASSYSNEQVGPHLARLNLDISGGAWCPTRAISSSTFGKEWIQVKLNRSYVVSAIETQGRFGMANGKEGFVPNYQVEYSRNGGATWHKWKDIRGSVLLRGNENVHAPVRNELVPPIVGANVIRILPYSAQLRIVCLRFELHGCPYDEGAPLAYAMHDGLYDQRWGHLNDYTYDGLKLAGPQPHQLSGGLGQLVDGAKGLDSFAHNNGYEWVGWKSTSGELVVEFTFKTLRNFTGALFHANNQFSQGVEVFQGVDVHYGVDVAQSEAALRDALVEQRRRDSLGRLGRRLSARELLLEQANALAELQHLHQHQAAPTLWSADVQSIEYEPDKRLESARPVTVHLKHRLANKLRFSLKFASKWVLISEVEFLSQPVEMMSLATLSERDTPPLLNSLATAKTYDEYVAILREHQLRRIAANAYFDSMSSPTTSTSTSTSSSTAAQDTSADQPSGAEQQPEPRPANAPVIPFGPAADWSPANAGMPATNPLLNAQAPSIVFGPHQPASQNQNQILDSGFPLMDFNQQPSDFKSANRQTIGLATVISFGLVAILLLLALVFAVSSYRLRHAPKLGVGLPRHLCNPSAGKATSSAAGGLLHSVFASNTHSVRSQMLSGQHQALADQQHQYNTLFATSARLMNGSPQHRQPSSTMRKLASLATGKSNSSSSRSTSGSSDQNCPSQLLVSLKDSYNGTPTNAKGVSTQLIVGLNQANPLAQQQIYNNSSSNMNCSNQTYATHYSASMGSSSTTGHQGDNGDYAIPDTTAGSTQMAPYIQQSHTFKHPFGYQTTDMRSSFRHPQQSSLVQPLLFPSTSVNRQQPEHNYELIYQDQQQQQQLFHNKTLSNQMGNCQQQQPFSSMTLSGRQDHQVVPAPRRT